MDFIKSGQFISELRKEKCMTQADLGTILGVTDKTVSKWERGVNIPDILMIREIAKVFNVTADEILNAERDKTDVSTILKFYRNKKLRYALIGICSAFIIFTLVLLVYFTNNYDKSKIYKFKSTNENYKITGYIYGIGNDVRVVVDDLYIEDIEKYEKLNITYYKTQIYLNDIVGFSKTINFEGNDYIGFLEVLNYIKKLSVWVEGVNTDLQIKNGKFIIEFLSTDDKLYQFEFNFDCSIDLRNNRFFYN